LNRSKPKKWPVANTEISPQNDRVPGGGQPSGAFFSNEEGWATACLGIASPVSPRPMTRFFDMDDRARLPWRFFGAMRAVLARLS